MANTGQCILDTESIDKSHVVWVDDVTQDTVDGITGFFLFVSNYGIKKLWCESVDNSLVVVRDDYVTYDTVVGITKFIIRSSNLTSIWSPVSCLLSPDLHLE